MQALDFRAGFQNCLISYYSTVLFVQYAQMVDGCEDRRLIETFVMCDADQPPSMKAQSQRQRRFALRRQAVLAMILSLASRSLGCSFLPSYGTSSSCGLSMRRFGYHCASPKHSEGVEDTGSSFIVQGMECVPVTINLPVVGSITVLEASADSQDVLVNVALQEEGEISQGHTAETVSLPTGDPYGAVLWPAATTIASCLIRQNCTNQTILELGAGTGLVSLAALAAGAKRVVATDYEEFPLTLLQHAADHCNDANNMYATVDKSKLETAHLDLCDFEQPLAPFVQDVDWVVAADVMYEPRTGRALAKRVVQALQAGCRVLVGDSPGRPGRPAFLKALKEAGVMASFVDFKGTTVTGQRHDLICGPSSKSVSAVPQELEVAVMELDPGDYPSLTD